ncbi:DUF1668 domain-containing protein [Pseudonocardia sp. GCM10023141]|uniref:DUF1668 domain-containing protein n=1 Tax=Pseudonocardia sp. GCM10023141 TaxID=3252653 RepID=UPI0036204732
MTTDHGSAHTAGGRPAVVLDLNRAGFSDATEVGRGGFGVVFRCHQEALNRTVAVKLLHTDLDTVSRERFFREGRAMGGLSGHPNVVDVLQVGVTDSGRPYIVMPFQSLDSLAARVRREGPVVWTDAIRLGVRLAGALESAHRVGTLHRDVKPANILLSDYGEAQLTDFGIARIEGGFETATGAFTGSLSYTAPEVLNGHPPTPASDIYGLAAALFSIIAGRAAFERREGEEIIAQFLRITGQPVPDLRGHGVPDELCDVLERAMAKNPLERPASSEEFGHELQEVQRAAGLPVAEMALPAARPTPRPLADGEVTEMASRDDLSPHRVSAPLPIVDRPWVASEMTVVQPPSRPQTGSHQTGSHSTGSYQTHSPETQRIAPVPAPRPAPPDHRDNSGGQQPPQRPWPPNNGQQGPPPPQGPRRRKPWTLVAIAAVVVLLAGLVVGGVYLVRDRFGANTAAAAGTGQADVAEPDVPASAWRPLDASPTKRQQVASTVADGTIWVIGGLTDTGASTKVEGFDSAINTWKTAIDLPVALHHAMAVTYAGEIVVLSGWQPVGSDLTAIFSNKVYAQRGGGWPELPPMAGPHVAGGAAVVGNKIIVVGGQSAKDTLATTTEVFDGTKWTLGAPMPTPREHLAVVTDGTFVYAIGGRNLTADKNTAVVERYDPVANKWLKMADMPTPRGSIGAAVADGRIVVVGGEDATHVFDAVEAYDIVSNSWSTMPKMTTPRHGAAVAAVGKTIYAIDGAAKPSHQASSDVGEAFTIPPRRLVPAAVWRPLQDAPVARQFTGSAVVDGTLWVAGGLTTGVATPQVFGYDMAIDKWKAGPDLPIPLHHTVAVAYKGELVVIGGWTPKDGNQSGAYSDKVFALRAGAWVELPPLKQPRAAMGAAVVGDRIVVAGGQNNKKLVATTEVFDGTAWTESAPIPTPREHTAATSDGKYVYVVGGRDLSPDKNSAALERFDPATGKWQKLASMPTPRGGVAATYVDGRIVAAGGEEPTRVLDTVEAYDIATGTWSKLAPLTIARHGMAIATLGNSVVTVGGAKRPTHEQSAANAEALDFS